MGVLWLGAMIDEGGSSARAPFHEAPLIFLESLSSAQQALLPDPIPRRLLLTVAAMASRAALRSVARRPPLIARSPAPIFSPSIRRWASSSSPSVKQRLRHPSQMGASDMFLVLSLLGGVAYVGTQFGRAGDERRARLAKSDAVEPGRRSQVISETVASSSLRDWSVDRTSNTGDDQQKGG